MYLQIDSDEGGAGSNQIGAGTNLGGPGSRSDTALSVLELFPQNIYSFLLFTVQVAPSALLIGTSTSATEGGKSISYPSTSTSQTQLAMGIQTGDLPALCSWSFGWQRRLSTLTARQLNTMRLLALRRLAMTCQVCTRQIFTLYCFTKCTYCMSSCSLKHTDSGTLTALLSLVSSFHQFTPPLVVLSATHTQEKRPL